MTSSRTADSLFGVVLFCTIVTPGIDETDMIWKKIKNLLSKKETIKS